MNQSKFENFLDDYLLHLSKGNTNDLKSLYNELDSNHRLWAPVIIKAKLKQSEKVWKHDGLKKEFGSVQNISSSELMIGMLTNSPDIPIELRKVWNSFIAIDQQDEIEKEKMERLKEKLREKLKNNNDLFVKCCKKMNIDHKKIKEDIKSEDEILNKREALDLLDMIRKQERAR